MMKMRRYECTLSKEEREEGRLWRIEKCGYDSHDRLVEVFTKEVKDGKN